MTPTARRIAQIALVSFGLLMGVAVIGLQVWVSPGVCTGSGGTSRGALLLGTVGGVLEGIGIIGMTVGTALGLPPGVSPPLVPGGLRGRNRAIRQIAGKEPYRVDEIAQLRLFAAHVVSSSRPLPAHGIAAFGLVLAGVGILLGAPTVLASDSVTATVYIVGVGIALLLVVAQRYQVRRSTRSGVANAEAFLQRTQPVAPDAPGHQ